MQLRLAGLLTFAACGGTPSIPDANFDNTDDVNEGAPDARPEVSGGTQHALVLLPGLFGYTDVAGVVEYFHEIPAALEEAGCKVHVLSPSAAASPEALAAALIPELRTIAEQGSGRVNVIGHSLGGIAARVIAAEAGDIIASVTTVGSPHRGTSVADFIVSDRLGTADDTVVQLAAQVVQLINGAGADADARAALSSLTHTAMADLNARYPAALPASPCAEGAAEVDGVRYYSWAGVGRATAWGQDPSDLLLLGLGEIMDAEVERRDEEGISVDDDHEDENDGVVGRCSAHLGQVIDDSYPLNHMDLVNGIAGVVDDDLSPVQLYLDHCARLRDAGL